MSSPVRSVAVRLSMDPASYIAGASRAEASTLSLDRAVSKVGGSATSSMEAAAKGAGTAEGALGKLNKTAGALGLTMGGLAGVGTAVAAGLSIKWAGDYQAALTRLVTTAGESPAKIKQVGQAFLDMAGQVGISAEEIAKGAYTAESAGFHGADAVTVMKAASEGARQENADLGKVVNATTTILHDYHLKASDAATVTSQLITAVSHGKVSFDELTGALDAITPLAAKANISIADVTGTLAAMTASGMSADQATQNMQNTLLHLVNPTGTMISELSQLGISTDDLAHSMSTKGLAGTLQMVEEAIVAHVDPATQRVLLPALNASKSAAQDLQIMIAKMPPSLAKLSEALLNGSMNQQDFRKAAIGLGGQAGVMADQFLTLYKSSDGFNSVLKAGGPAQQVFTAAMAKALGTTSALNVALQTTGENAAATNSAIKDIAGASAQADGNIKGWDEVQGNFNQKLAQAEQGMKSLAIEAGQHLLPMLTSAVGWIGSTGVPGIEQLGHGVGDVAHLFGELPGPVRDATLAFAAFKIASSIGFLSASGSSFLGGVTGAVKATATSVASLSGEMQVQQALFAAEARDAELAATGVGGLNRALGATAASATAADAGLTRVQMMLRGYDVTLAETTAAQQRLGLWGDTAGASLGRLGAGGATIAARGLSAAKTAGAGLMSMLGGPWGVAIVGATLGITALTSMNKQLDEQLKKNTADVTAWYKTLALGGSTGDVIKAQQHLDGLRDKLAAVTDKINAYNAASAGGNGRGGIGTLVTQQAELRTELDKGKKAWDEQLAAMTPVELATARLQTAESKLAEVRKDYPPNSQIVIAAEAAVATAQHNVAGETDNATRAQKNQIQTMQDAANAALGQIDAQRALEQAQLGLSDAVARYKADLNDTTVSASQLRQEQLGLVDTAESVAKAAGDAAAKQAAANGATDTGAASQAAFMHSLQDTAATLDGPAKQAVLDIIDKLGATETQAAITAGAVNQLGITVVGLPTDHLITIDAPTDKQMQDLHDLKVATVTLPDGKVVVTADTNPAQTAIMDLLNYARTQSILYRATLPDLNGSASGSGRPGLATGGWVRGPGTGTSDEVPIMGSNGEFMVKAKAAARHATLLEAINSDRVPGYAQGGWINVPPGGAYMGSASIPVSVDGSAYKNSIHAALAAAAAPGAPAAVSGNVALGQTLAAARGWTGAQWNALYALWQRESGWRNTAQNPTSTAFGIPQLLDGTWAGTGYGKTSDSRIQILAGENYIAGRYVDPIGAWAHEQRVGWYHSGGPVVGPAGTDVPAVLRVGEMVRTAEQEAQVQRQLRSREFAGSSLGGGGVHNSKVANYTTHITAGPSADEIARKVADRQRDMEFLHG